MKRISMSWSLVEAYALERVLMKAAREQPLSERLSKMRDRVCSQLRRHEADAETGKWQEGQAAE